MSCTSPHCTSIQPCYSPYSGLLTGLWLVQDRDNLEELYTVYKLCNCVLYCVHTVYCVVYAWVYTVHSIVGALGLSDGLCDARHHTYVCVASVYLMVIMMAPSDAPPVIAPSFA
jgi:hypothetical protein